MARSIAQLEAEIATLQRQAEALRQKEVAGVVNRIKAAIDHYQLTAADLGFESQAAKSKNSKRNGLASSSVRRRKTVGKIRFRDEHGNAWTGHGRAPGWFKDAVASGRTREDLAVKQ